jgi:hypothetical protein
MVGLERSRPVYDRDQTAAGANMTDERMTDAKMLQNLLAVYEAVVRLAGIPTQIRIKNSGWLFGLKEVIAELRRRIEMEEVK